MDDEEEKKDDLGSGNIDKKDKEKTESPKQITMDDVKNVMSSMLDEKLTVFLPKKEEEKKEEKNVEEKTESKDMPEWAKKLFSEVAGIKSNSKTEAETKLANTKKTIATKYGIEISELDGFDSEKSLSTFEKNMDKIVNSNKEKFEKEIPDILKKQGKAIAEINNVNKDTEKKKTDAFGLFKKLL